MSRQDKSTTCHLRKPQQEAWGKSGRASDLDRGQMLMGRHETKNRQTHKFWPWQVPQGGGAIKPKTNTSTNMENFNPSYKSHHSWTLVVSLPTAGSTGKMWGEWLTACLYEVLLRAWWTIRLGPHTAAPWFISTFICNNWPHASPNLVFDSFVVFFIRRWGCSGVLVLCLTIFVWGLDLELHHHHHSTPTWEFLRSGVMSGEAPPRQTDQECTNLEGKKEEAEVGSSQENTALHCSPTFAFHSSPLCFKITPFY